MARTAKKRSTGIYQQSEMTQAYHLRIEMEDYLFFASMEKGKVAETAPLIHNYSLAYALGWCESPYYFEKQTPRYQEHLQPLNEAGKYIYPAIPLDYSHRLMQYNTTPEPFQMTREQSMGFPNWGFIKCIRPGSVFETYVLSSDVLSLPGRIRLGKWMSQAKLVVSPCEIKKGEASSSPHLINVKDIDRIPSFFSSMYNIMPTRLVSESEWGEAVPGYQVRPAFFTKNDQAVFLPEASFGRSGA
ncbi:type I-D CRISPR-associated protein Cas5/Csc1 [Marininema halotolerans]|uniref:CRISPR-associated protein Csc1 n=1 Tax=Marininema halotolerans TaxID=1155944 RepID=A0A1I6SDX3_9BACL|nr:type I-D CRISPR-associated protein Cas5/Csc1 [Marininema halotolerans]SFS75103.1 CRISPR-associated protein Csc1 [Marininema halotolerans]